MSETALTSLPNVSTSLPIFPSVPCTPNLVAIWTPEPWLQPGRETETNPAWLCYDKHTHCPTGTKLYVSKFFGYRVCTPDEPRAVQMYGPNVADLEIQSTPIPTLSEWALLATMGFLALTGYLQARK